MPSLLPFLVAAAVAALPLSWLVSRWLDVGTAWTVKLLLSGLLSAAVLTLLQLAWRLVGHLRARRKVKRELVERKARLWNKLSGLGTPLANCKTLCLEEYANLRRRICSGELAPVDVLEAFQARTLLLDRQSSKIKEVVYDADVHAFMLEGGKAATVLMPAATFYYNAALAPAKTRNADGEVSMQDNPVVTALRLEGAIDIGQVDKEISQVSGLLLNQGAHFFAGQYPASQLPAVLRAIASKPVCAALLSRDQPGGKFLALLAGQSRLPSLAAAAVTPGMRDHLMQQQQQQQEDKRPLPLQARIGFVFVHQRRSQADGRQPPGEDSVANLLESAIKQHQDQQQDQLQLVRGLNFDRLLAASAGGGGGDAAAAAVRAAAKAALAEHSLDGLAVVAGRDCRLAEQLAGFMDLSVFHLTEQLAELYLCHPHDRLRVGLAVAQAFGAAIHL